jgi:hypothetical protein
MATKVILALIDDIDGSDADETVSFSLDTVDYAIELAERNAAALRESLATYIAAARKTSQPTQSIERVKKQANPQSPQARSIRG